MMENDVYQFLKVKKGYQKWGAARVAKMLKVSVKTVKAAKERLR